MFDGLLNTPLDNSSNFVRDHSFSTYAKFSERLTFLTP